MASKTFTDAVPAFAQKMAYLAEKFALFSSPSPLPASSKAVRRLHLVEKEENDDPQFRQVAFTMAVISLSAKLARVDGKVTMEEFLVFRELFPMQDHLSSKIRDLFMAACDDSTSYEYHARQVTLLFPGRENLLTELLERLFQIAAADGAINMRERDYLNKIARILGFSTMQFNRLLARYETAKASDPYKVLGVSSKATDEDLKRAYRRLIRENHPDGLSAWGVSEELIKLAGRKVVAINEAYDIIQRRRGLKGSPNK